MIGKQHEFLSICVLIVSLPILTFLLFLTVGIHAFLISQFVIAWILQTYYINNDLDAEYSRSKKRVGFFKYMFLFATHHGIMHSPLFWAFICVICGYLGYPLFGLGLLGSSLVHIGSDVIHHAIPVKVRRFLHI
jgi:uncharacterized metal-binding protein